MALFESVVDYLPPEPQDSLDRQGSSLGDRGARARQHPRRRRYLPQLQQELLAVLAKYENIDLQHVSVKLDKTGDCEVLELNITLPEQFVAKKAHAAL